MLNPFSKKSELVQRFLNKENESKTPGVYLGTLHSSKGLEFENVWICQVNEGVIPDVKELTNDAEEEERRLLYVGITRAKNTLFISHTEYPSKFICEAKIGKWL